MPEGPEVWILCKAIDNKNITSYGKQLWMPNGEVWSFGLKGKVRFNEEGILSKAPGNESWITGGTNEIKRVSKADWMSASEEQLNEVVNQWRTSRKTIASLLLDQSEISGIGVAWGSEICHMANVDPTKKARECNLNLLVCSFIQLKNNVQMLYDNELSSCSDHKLFIHEWFENLYAIRKMKLYQCGTKVKISGRTWYV
jgi:formamidopyrimidine-DNA glycosylase